MEAIIILSIGTIIMLIIAWKKPAEKKAPYLITALIFLILIGSHKMFNPTLQEDFHKQQTTKKLGE